MKFLSSLLLGLIVAHTDCFAQTDGGARLEVTLLDYNGSSTKHWTVVWITTQSGAFIKSLRKQGPSWTATHWDSHCSVWNTARGGSAGGSQVLDGYSSATAQNYTGTNSPITLTWNGRNASNQLLPDGKYKFWVQYAEDSGQGPYTTGGLLWTKGPAGETNTYASQGVNFANMKVTWNPNTPPTITPTITSLPPTATGTVGVTYQYNCTATGTPPISFTATGLPAGLTIGSDGVISGRPTETNVCHGIITAGNGMLPNATQAFLIAIDAVPMHFTSVNVSGNDLLITGRGAAHGMSYLLVATNVNPGTPQWIRIATNIFDDGGSFNFTNTIDTLPPQGFYLLQFP